MSVWVNDRCKAASSDWVIALVIAMGSIAPTFADEGTEPAGSAMAPIARDFWNSDEAARLGAWIAERLDEQADPPESLVMFADILRGSQLGPEDGWFRRPTGGTRFDWKTVRDRYDTSGNGRIEPDEWSGPDADFKRLDRDGDGAVSAPDFDFSAHALTRTPGVMLHNLADTDSNGKVTRDEFLNLFDRLDQDDLGFLSRNTLRDLFSYPTYQDLMFSGLPEGMNVPARPTRPSKATLVEGLVQQEIGALWPGPDVGDPAPDFTLQTVDGDREITLSQYQDQSNCPVVLVFGNFTCGPFRSQAGNIETLYRRYQNRAAFLMVYVREAHPTDGWHMFDNDLVGVSLSQPQTFDERVKVARTCQKTLDFDMPFLVDTIGDRVGTRYSGMPARLYLIDRDGTIAFKSGRGPFGFKPDELEQALIFLLGEESESCSGTTVGEGDATPVSDDVGATP